MTRTIGQAGVVGGAVLVDRGGHVAYGLAQTITIYPTGAAAGAIAHARNATDLYAGLAPFGVAPVELRLHQPQQPGDQNGGQADGQRNQ